MVAFFDFAFLDSIMIFLDSERKGNHRNKLNVVIVSKEALCDVAIYQCAGLIEVLLESGGLSEVLALFPNEVL